MMSCASLVGEDVQLSTSIKTNSPCELQGKTIELMSCVEAMKFYRTFENEPVIAPVVWLGKTTQCVGSLVQKRGYNFIYCMLLMMLKTANTGWMYHDVHAKLFYF